MNTGLASGVMMPRTRSSPGVEANPIVRISSPTSARVCGSGSTYTPTVYVRSAQAIHASSANMLRNAMFSVPPVRLLAPIPPAILDSRTTAKAWAVAVVSASTSS